MKTFLLLIPFLFICSCSDSYKIEAEISNYGLMKIEDGTLERNSQLIAGENHISDNWKFLSKTETIPNKIGIEFGIEYKIRNYPANKLINVEEIMLFPGDGLTNPYTGVQSNVDIEKVSIDPSFTQFFSYQLEKEWERKSGKWIFQVKYQNKIIAEQAFTVQ